MNRKFKGLALIICSISYLAFSGCTTALGIANHQSVISPLAYEGHNDTTSVEKEALYVSGFYSKSIEDSDNHVVDIAGASIYKSHTLKAYSYSYGAFGYAGNFRVGSLYSADLVQRVTLNSNEAFFGSGITGGSSLRIGKRRKFLDLGLRLSLLYEGGEYSDFRETARNDLDFEDRHPNRLTMHTAAQMTFKFRISQLNFGVYNSLGMTSFGGDGLTPLLNMGLFVRHKRLIFNTDISAGHLDSQGLTTFGLAYRLN